ncbi:family 2 glycosyl transferase [Sphingomonas sp. Leaf33]|uniref:glycosyltransferase family 2 protein n=1 Tax=Sphingomonas sp. Leaf33 TaxID=1736215 RepID=UPI00070119E9|nr:glycosyltransferase family 2 protein [Sphingomonas sp. Leaf33]KQN26605.1 family 2 glycosyl transferase [Sphingomonas sp. Leaf33]
MTRPSLAAALIVRNEARCLKRCLDSVAPWVDRMVAVDTGSTDATPGIGRACGATVATFDWIDDFAAARNHALSIADADWTLVIDADEWIADGGAGLRDWCSGDPRIGVVAIDNLLTGKTLHRNWISRLLPRGTWFEGRIHEQVASGLARERCPLVLGHDGYVPDRIATKSARNRPLLLRALAERPDDGYLLKQLGRDAEVAGEYDAANDWYARALDRTPADANWRHELVLGAISSLAAARRFDEATALADREFAHWQHSPDFFFVLGNLMLDRAVADTAQAIGEWLPLAQGAWERCLAIGEQPLLEGSVAGRGSHLARHNLSLIAPMLRAHAA